MAPRISVRKVLKHGRERFLVDLRSAGSGRRFFDTRAAAVSFVEEAKIDAKQHGALAWELPHSERLRFLGLERAAADMGTTLEAILEWYRKTHVADPTTVSAAVDACLAAKRASGKRPRSIEQLGYSLALFAGSYGALQCAQVTPTQIETWLANPKWKSLATRKTKLTDIRTLFSFALKRGWVRENPVLRLEPIVLEAKPPGILTVNQVAKLLAVCTQHEPTVLPYFAVGIFSGIRPSELHRLSWDQVDLDRGLIHVAGTVSKTRARRLVTLRPVAVAWLRLGGNLPPTNWKRMWTRVRIAAGFRLGRRRAGAVWPHDAMRHSFVSYSVPMFGAAETALEAGHSEQILFDKYREVVSKEDAERFWALTPDKVLKRNK